jgi:hypothetical protein
VNVRRGVWRARLLPLLERPGEVQRIALGARGPMTGLASALRNGQTRLPAGRWDIAARELDTPVDGHSYAVFASYLGPALRVEEPNRFPGYDPLTVAVELPAPDAWPRRARNLRSVGGGRVR